MTATPRHVIFGTGAIGLAALDALRRRGETVRLVKPVRLRPRPAPPLIASCLFSAIGGSLRCGDSVDTDPIPPARVSATAVKHAAVPEMATKVVVRKPSANSSRRRSPPMNASFPVAWPQY